MTTAAKKGSKSVNKGFKSAVDRIAHEKELIFLRGRLSNEVMERESLRQQVEQVRSQKQEVEARLAQAEARLVEETRKLYALAEECVEDRAVLHQRNQRLERQLRAALNLAAELGA